MTPAEIKEARERLGLSQAQLAKRLDVTADTVAKWEQGVRKPHPLRNLPAELERLQEARP